MRVMRDVVAAFGGRLDWVERRFSVGAALLAFERGESSGQGLGLSNRWQGPKAPFDPDLSSPETMWEIGRRNQWVKDSLPYSLQRDIRTDDALRAMLETQGYPFIASSATQLLAADPLPMAVIGAQELLPVYEEHFDEEAGPISRREDGHPILINLTEEVLFVGAGSHIHQLPRSEAPSSYIPKCVEQELLVSAGHDKPLAEVRLERFQPEDTEIWDLPEREDGIIYIVPWDIVHALPNRDDLVIAGDRSRPSGWKYIDPEGADSSVPEDHWDRWVLKSVISGPV